jgi:hypothetical protein
MHTRQPCIDLRSLRHIDPAGDGPGTFRNQLGSCSLGVGLVDIPDRNPNSVTREALTRGEADSRCPTRHHSILSNQ